MQPFLETPFIPFWCRGLFLGRAEKRLKACHKPQYPLVSDTIVDKIGIFAAIDDPLITKNSQMLGNITVGCLHYSQEIADGQFFFLEQAEDLKAYGVGHGLKESCDSGNFSVLHAQYFVTVFKNLS